MARIDRFYRRFHSLRYVDGRLVLRLSQALEPQDLQGLEERFSDLLTPGGGMTLSGPLREENGAPELAGLQRLVVDFNRQDFGRLCNLIDELNEL